MFIHNWGSKKECSILKGLQNAILHFCNVKYISIMVWLYVFTFRVLNKQALKKSNNY
jgi:hypothetical protein